MKKLLWFIVFTAVVSATFLLAQKTDLPISKRWEKVNEFAQKQLPESALKEVEIILNQAQEEKNSVEVIKALVYKMRFTLEKDPDQAPTLIHDFEVFTDKCTDNAERALLHSMTAELYAKYFQRDQWNIIQRTEIKGIVPDDLKEWTKNIYYDKVSKHLAASLENASVLQKTDAMKFGSLLQKGNDSRTLQPTLFDFLAYRRIQILQLMGQSTTVKNPLKSPDLFADFTQLFTLKIDTAFKASIENASVETYQKLLAFRLKENNELSLIFADLHYLRYIKQHTENESADSLYLLALNRLKEQYYDNEAVVEVYGELANLYMQNANFKDNKKIANEICTDGIKRFPKYNRISMLENMQNDITRKDISINYNQVVKPASNLKIKISTSNIPVLKLKVFEVKASAQEYYQFKQNNRNSKKLYPNNSLLETRLVDVESDLNFGNVNTEITLKSHEYGIYEFTLEAVDNENESQRVIGTLAVTDLAFMMRTNKSEKTDMYVLDRNTGKPQPKVKVNRYNNKWKGNGYEIQQINQYQTDLNGLCQFPFDTNYSNNIFFFEKGNDKYFSSNSNSYFNPQSTYQNKDVNVNLFTDRSLYRPGQTVYFKAIAYYANKEKQETVAKEEYEVTLFDVNNQEVAKKKFMTNEFGSFAGEFILPDGGLNGCYQIRVGNSSENIWVEEYKRPTFEVKIAKPKMEINFGEKVTLIGNVKAYSGYNVDNAKVKYRVVRRTHRYCWWWSEPDKEITNGTTVSKADGTFEVTFIPEKTKQKIARFLNEQFYSYTVNADVTDPKGETQHGEQTLSVGEKSLFILAEITEKVDKKQAFNTDITTETLNGEKLNSIVKYNLYRLELSDVYAEKLDEKTVLKEAEKVLSGNFDTKNKNLNLDLNKMASGRYKIVFTTPDAHGNEVKLEKTFLLYSSDDNRLPVKCYVWFLTPKIECELGEKAQIQFGTSTKNTSVLYEVMQGNNILESRWISFSNEIKLLEVPFKETYGAGVTVMFSFMKDEQFFTQQVQITRKIVDKKLTPTLSVFRDKLKPGEKAEWTVTIPESAANKKMAELLVGMYDASLDQLRPHNWSFNPTYHEPVLYSPQWQSCAFNTASDATRYNYYIQKSVPDFITDQLNWFGLDISGRSRMMIRGFSTMSKSIQISDVAMAQENSVLDEAVVVGYGTQKRMDVTGSVASISNAMAGKKVVGTGPKTELQEPVQIRTNFNETAFFYPQLRTDAQGNVKFAFTAPESMTRWNLKMLAHTKDLYFGQNEAQVLTQKDLMVQLNMPRFVRRSDKLVLCANVVNMTDKTQTANVKFELIDPATEKPIKLKDSGIQTVTVPTNETKTVQWELTEFSNYELVICKVVARAGNFSDGEQKYLPVLPDKIRVTESMPLTIRGNQMRTFSFESLLKSGSKVDNKSLTVEFSSNPTWYAVQALPTLSIPESDNAIDYFTAYYVNSLATFIANSNPKIAATFDRWKKAGGSRDALLSNLEKNKELKNMLLEETPWVVAAKDETEQKKQIALLFDLNMQKNQAQQYLDKLVSLQMPSGGFSWFKGMPESRYVTQEIMLNLARLSKMTGTVNYQLSTINSALSYLDLEIAHDFEELKKGNKNYDKEMCVGNIQLFYLHLRSEYPTVPVQVSAQEAVRFYTAQSEKYWTKFSLYGKAMMVMVANRNGKIQLANNVLKSLKENALKTDELGMYWAKNTAGYFWNEQPIAVQSGIIEAFAEISRNQTDIDEMKIWLLKQKQTQRWDSPLSTVDAIYSLLHYGTDWLANDGTVKITVGNTILQPQSVEAGTGYFKQTIPTADIRPEMGNVTVNKSVAGIGWGAMYWQYAQDLDKISVQSEPLKITKKLFVEKMQPTGKTMIPIEQTELKKGDKVITRLVITTDRNLEFVALKDLRAACFEPVDQQSACIWKEGVCYYKTTKDASTQFFFSYLPKGTYVFEYELWANSAGEYTSGIASLQCQYAPEFVSHTGGERIRIR